MDLPNYRYHPDPLATNAIVTERITCCVCSKVSSYSYQGQMYCEEEHGSICPWYIFDGAAAAKFGEVFSNDNPLLSNGVKEEIVKEVTQRTLGFQTWQQEIWLSHCGEAAGYLGDSVELV
ncbi:MAG: CbrC family protein [Proteobacteria bacterium]|nr:CbrC family protein [Pseudomonadota bacterium]